MPYSYLPILKICLNCGVEFVPFPRAKGFYCSTDCSGEYRKRAAIERFMDKVIPEPNSGCWIWIGAILKNGYGSFSPDGNRYTVRAHRFSYQYFHGPIPRRFYVRHKCDFKPCVNPDHLHVGTQLDNINDAIERGLWPIGSRAGNAKLTEEIVAMARSQRMRPSELSRLTGISPGTASVALSGKTWRHVHVEA